MTLATEVKKLTESKPFYAVAGVGDYAVEKLRELPEQLLKLQSRRTELAKDLPVKAREYADKAEGIAREFPEKAREYADQLSHKATEVYEDFATRGRQVVSKTTGEAALELEEVSVAAEPPVAEPIEPVKKTRTTKTTKTTQA
ncbi:hypothetical protein B0I32_111256 [Nonomuraea fuscirosea]|uniref:Heparin binding hemagglutinin HbhA n=1 Tax=Nonomuraea fuscirosea TaxID=1291556 RepID=A0A2T0MWC9_9ACTN|nr:hypothetical protein [Nonomuraea fuscirosea]PRX63262.1 hypothetical protein B0I32_111256 [Nonomuraea fuscirosea]